MQDASRHPESQRRSRSSGGSRRKSSSRRKPKGRLAKWLIGYLATVGVAAHVAFAGGLLLALRHFDLTPRQAVVKVVEKAGLDGTWVETLLSPRERFPDHALDGQLVSQRPRILLPDLRDWDGLGVAPSMRLRAGLLESAGLNPEQYPACGGDLIGQTACWVSTGDEAAGRKALSQLTTLELLTPNDHGQYGNIWMLAWAYDLLSLHPEMDQRRRDAVEAKLAKGILDYLLLLDSDSPSLWHGRATLASQAWLTAAALDPGNPMHKELIRRAQSHFVDVMRALSLSEGWPEGYNYWINSRGFLLTLASAAYVNALEDADYAPIVRRNLERVGLWTLYITRGDNRVEALGDEGPRMDLKDETRRVIDIIAQTTRNPVFATFSAYLEKTYGRESYYRDYRWGLRLFNDPTVPTLPGVGDGSLEGLELSLPPSFHFGPGGLNQVVSRTGWGPDDTLVTFRAGHTMTHHGHYDAGHFTLFKGAPLVITNATYQGDVSAPHRLYYGVRTVSKNSLLVMRPNETIKPSRLVQQNVIDGGQRVVIPTGSAVTSVSNWLANLKEGRHYAGGEITHYQHLGNTLTFVRSDLTWAYDNTEFDTQDRGGRVQSVRRDLLHLLDEDHIFIHDDVVATSEDYTKKWLLHLPQRPEAPGLRPLLGNHAAGILETSADRLSMSNQGARLDVLRIAPAGAVVRLVGGPGFEYYVESDGDDSDLDGENFAEGSRPQPWFDNGLWRIELQPRLPAERHQFVVALTPSLDSAGPAARLSPVEVSQRAAYAVSSDRSVIVFPTDDLSRPVSFTVPGRQERLIIAGVVAGQVLEVSLGASRQRIPVTESGAMIIPMAGHRGLEVTIQSAP